MWTVEGPIGARPSPDALPGFELICIAPALRSPALRGLARSAASELTRPDQDHQHLERWLRPNRTLLGGRHSNKGHNDLAWTEIKTIPREKFLSIDASAIDSTIPIQLADDAKELPATYAITLYNLQAKKAFTLVRRGVEDEVAIGPESEVTIEDGDKVTLGPFGITLTFHWRPIALALTTSGGTKHRADTDELLRSVREWLGAIGGRISTTLQNAQPAPATTHLAVCTGLTTSPALFAATLRGIPIGSREWLEALKSATHMPELTDGDGQPVPSDARTPGQGFAPLELDYQIHWPDPAAGGGLKAVMKGDVAQLQLTDSARWQPDPERKRLFTNLIIASARPPAGDKQAETRIETLGRLIVEQKGRYVLYSGTDATTAGQDLRKTVAALQLGNAFKLLVSTSFESPPETIRQIAVVARADGMLDLAHLTKYIYNAKLEYDAIDPAEWQDGRPPATGNSNVPPSSAVYPATNASDQSMIPPTNVSEQSDLRGRPTGRPPPAPRQRNSSPPVAGPSRPRGLFGNGGSGGNSSANLESTGPPGPSGAQVQQPSAPKTATLKKPQKDAWKKAFMSSSDEETPAPSPVEPASTLTGAGAASQHPQRAETQGGSVGTGPGALKRPATQRGKYGLYDSDSDEDKEEEIDSPMLPPPPSAKRARVASPDKPAAAASSDNDDDDAPVPKATTVAGTKRKAGAAVTDDDEDKKGGGGGKAGKKAKVNKRDAAKAEKEAAAKEQAAREAKYLQVNTGKRKVGADDAVINAEFNKLKIVKNPTVTKPRAEKVVKAGWNDVEVDDELAAEARGWTSDFREGVFVMKLLPETAYRPRREVDEDVDAAASLTVDPKYAGRPNFKAFRPKEFGLLPGAFRRRENIELVEAKMADFGLGAGADDDADESLNLGLGKKKAKKSKAKPATAKGKKASTPLFDRSSSEDDDDDDDDDGFAAPKLTGALPKVTGKARKPASTSSSSTAPKPVKGGKAKGKTAIVDSESDELEEDEPTPAQPKSKAKGKAAAAKKPAASSAASKKKASQKVIELDSDSDDDDGAVPPPPTLKTRGGAPLKRSQRIDDDSDDDSLTFRGFSAPPKKRGRS